MRLGRCRVQHQRHQFIKTFAALLSEVARYRTLPKRLQPAHYLAGLFKSGCRQGIKRFLVTNFITPHVCKTRGMLAVRVINPGCRGCEHLLEVFLYQLPVPVELSPEIFPVGKSHRKSKPHLAGFILRQCMQLLVVPGLQPVFRAPQETVGLGQLHAGIHRQIVEYRKRIQYVQHTTLLQNSLTTTTHQLKGLRNKFNFTNPAGAKLDIVLQSLALDLTYNLLLETAQGIKGTEVEVTSVHKRTQHLQQLPGRRGRTGNGTCLDHGVALPLSTMQLVVISQRIKICHQRTTVAIGAQAHIDTKHKTMLGLLIEQTYQLLPQLQIKLLRRLAALFPYCLTVRVGKDQVDIR